MRPRLGIWALLALSLALAPTAARAHGMRSAYLEIEGLSDTAALVRLRIAAPGVSAEPSLEGCALVRLPGASTDDTGEVSAYQASCPQGLAVAAASVSGLGSDLEEAVVHWWLGERSHAVVLTAAAPRAGLPPRADPWAALSGMFHAGLAHIAGGVDHLLFLALLVVGLRRLGPLLLAETAFSLSHGIAFALTATGLVRVPAAPVEALIALSLVLLALEIGQRRQLAPRGAAAMALGFGAVHGLGFAGGLRELGVPEDHVAAAIVGFGAGVEVGQLAFVLVAWAALWTARRALARWPARGAALRVAAAASTALVVAVGSLSMHWLFLRGLTAIRGD